MLLCLLIGLKGWNLDTERDHCCCLPSTTASLGTLGMKGSSEPSGSLHPLPVSAQGTRVGRQLILLPWGCFELSQHSKDQPTTCVGVQASPAIGEGSRRCPRPCSSPSAGALAWPFSPPGQAEAVQFLYPPSSRPVALNLIVH